METDMLDKEFENNIDLKYNININLINVNVNIDMLMPQG
jgi:hypothetical protein